LSPARPVGSHGNTFLSGDTSTRQIIHACSPCFLWPSSPSFSFCWYPCYSCFSRSVFGKCTICPAILTLCSAIVLNPCGIDSPQDLFIGDVVMLINYGLHTYGVGKHCIGPVSQFSKSCLMARVRTPPCGQQGRCSVHPHPTT